MRLAGLIAMHARMAQPIRVVKYDDAHMTDVIAQHRKIIATMSGTDTDAYVAANREHLPASAEAYRNLYSRRFGWCSRRRVSGLWRVQRGSSGDRCRDGGHLSGGILARERRQA